MSSPELYDVQLAPAAARAFRRLPPADRDAIRAALRRLAVAVARPGERGGKASKTIRGTSDSFHRLRVGEYRVLYDVLPESQTVLVLGDRGSS